MRRCIAIVVALCAGCDSGRAPQSPPPAAPPPAPADATAVDAVIVDADLSYPKEWIDAAHAENERHACQQLIYKDGCRALRTGTVELDVTLDDQRKVASVRTRAIKISNDETLVEKCLLREVPKWRFHAPESHAHELVLTVILADMC